jgi:hypothetical protein
MLDASALAPGTRVRIQGKPIAVTLSADTGTILASDAEYDGYYVVHLDSPATYRHADGSSEELTEIVEYWDNLEVVEPAQ